MTYTVRGHKDNYRRLRSEAYYYLEDDKGEVLCKLTLESYDYHPYYSFTLAYIKSVEYADKLSEEKYENDRIFFLKKIIEFLKTESESVNGITFLKIRTKDAEELDYYVNKVGFIEDSVRLEADEEEGICEGSIRIHGRYDPYIGI